MRCSLRASNGPPILLPQTPLSLSLSLAVYLSTYLSLSSYLLLFASCCLPGDLSHPSAPFNHFTDEGHNIAPIQTATNDNVPTPPPPYPTIPDAPSFSSAGRAPPTLRSARPPTPPHTPRTSLIIFITITIILTPANPNRISRIAQSPSLLLPLLLLLLPPQHLKLSNSPALLCLQTKPCKNNPIIALPLPLASAATLTGSLCGADSRRQMSECAYGSPASALPLQHPPSHRHGHHLHHCDLSDQQMLPATTHLLPPFLTYIGKWQTAADRVSDQPASLSLSLSLSVPLSLARRLLLLLVLCGLPLVGNGVLAMAAPASLWCAVFCAAAFKRFLQRQAGSWGVR